MHINDTLDSYNTRFVPILFDLLIATIFAPFGGIQKLRSNMLDLIDLQEGMAILELGCGTGSITKLLLRRGANVVAVDGSYRMLERARRRAPGAVFIQQNLAELQIAGEFDVVLFAFVLHELDRSLRREVLLKATNFLSDNGVVAVLDHAVPSRGLAARIWRGLLMRFEPPTVAECIEEGYTEDLRFAGLQIVKRIELAGGTAAVMISKVSATSQHAA